jgi:hypothetical protein
MMGQVGMTPLGIGHDQNVYDRMMNQRFTLARLQAVQAAADLDRQGYNQAFRGLAAMTGTPWGSDQRHAANQLSSLLAAGAPALADMFPDLLDAMGGSRGSAAVMTSRVMDAGRYRIDPMTGLMGMTPQTATATTQRLFSHLYDPANIARMNGLTAGQAGSLFQQLQMRGVLGTGAAEAGFGGFRGDDPRSAISRAASDLNITVPHNATAQDFENLGNDPRIAERVRNIDTERVRRQLESYSGAVSAMREIFGDMGRPNAPMSELVSALEAMTGGGMSQFDPGRLQMMVRNTQNLAAQTGTSVGNAMLMQQHAAQRAASMGLEPAFAISAAQGGMAFGGAYRAAGMGAYPAWGLWNANAMQQMDTNLRVQAAASPAANRLNTAMRIADMGGITPGSDAAALVAAVRAGHDTWQPTAGGLPQSIVMSDDAFIRTMTAGRPGLSSGDVMTMLSQTSTNREYGDLYNTGDSIRRRQGPDEILPFMSVSLRDTIMTRVREQLMAGGMSHTEATRQATEVAGQISPGIMTQLQAVPESVRNNTTERNRALGGMITGALTDRGFLGGMSAEQRAQFGIATADIARGRVDTALANSRFGGNMVSWLGVLSPTALAGAAQQQTRARLTSELQSDLSGLRPGSLLANTVDAVRNAGTRADDPAVLQRVVSEALGGVSNQEINARILPHIASLRQREAQAQALHTQIMQAPPGPQRDALIAQLNAVRNEIRGNVSALSQIGTETGLIVDGGIGRGDLQNATDAVTSLTRSRADLSRLQNGDTAARARAWDELWGNPDGAGVLNRSDTFMRTAEDTADRLLSAPNMVQQFGQQAIDFSTQLREGSGRLRALASQYAGGDVRRLLAGDVRIDTSTEQGRTLRANVMNEIQGVISGQQGIYDRLRGMPSTATTPALPPEMIAEREALRLAALNRANPAPESLMRDIMGAYGLSPGETLTPGQRGLAQRLASRGGQDLGQTLLGSIRSLRDVAGRRAGGPEGLGGVDQMVQEYRAALGAGGDSEARLRAFQQTYGFDMSGGQLSAAGQNQWRSFENNVRLQDFGFARVGRGRTIPGALPGSGEFENVLERYLQTGQQTAPGTGTVGQGGLTGPVQMSGNVTLTVDPTGQAYLNMNGANLNGGGLNYTPNPG